MPNRFALLVLSSAIMFNLGCASKGFNRGALRDQAAAAKPVATDSEIKEILSKKPNLPKPFKLAVYFRDPGEAGLKVSTQWRWTEADKEALMNVVLELKKQGTVSDVFPIVNSLVKEDDLRSLRIVAAQHGADALLIFSGASDVDRYINKFGWSYLLLAPAFFIPGSEAQSLFIANASMWGVRNEYLYLTAESEGTYRERYIAAFGDDDKILSEKAKTAALDKIKTQVSNMAAGAKN